MIFSKSPLAGALLIEPERREDERGFFARTFCAEEFAARGLMPDVAQCNISFNRRPGTLRGLHYQRAPHGEVKLVRCTRGAVYDVIVDIRQGSPTFARWFAVELSAENRTMLYIPQGFAHGFQTLAEDTELFYQMSTAYVPEAAAGIRWDDPDVAIEWPAVSRVISASDQALPTLDQLLRAERLAR
jgi:dTDP-4-dehydrorhamnose 3,5-epimerase